MILALPLALLLTQTAPRPTQPARPAPQRPAAPREQVTRKSILKPVDKPTPSKDSKRLLAEIRKKRQTLKAEK